MSTSSASEAQEKPNQRNDECPMKDSEHTQKMEVQPVEKMGARGCPEKQFLCLSMRAPS